MLTAGILWVVGLAAALGASEILVHATSSLGDRMRFTPAIVGLVVALGADAPEVTSALVAAIRGSSDVSVGVVVGSNIYNLAGLLGLAALISGRVRTRAHTIPLDTAFDLVLIGGLITLVAAPALQLALAAVLLAVLAAYAVIEAVGAGRVPLIQGLFPEDEGVPDAEPPAAPHAVRPLSQLTLVVVSVVAIVGASDLLVTESVYLGPRLGIPNHVMGTVVLAIATSLPNTWAAISLARRHRSEAAIAATFNSNSINAAVGAGLPALFVTFHTASVTRTLDVAWLGLMTAVATALCALRDGLSRRDGAALLALYGAFLVLRFAIFG